MNDFDNKQICSYKDIDRFGFTCDVCGRKVNGCHYINGMKFCAKCYQETFGKDNQQNEIQQLKQQLEEYKNKENTFAVNSWDEMLKNCENCGLNECIGCEYTQTCVQNIKQQLAEKDNLIEFGREEIRKRNKRIDEIVERDKKLFDNKNKEIECLNKRIDRYENMFRSRIKRTGDIQKDIELYINQLAIQELEKVKNFVDGRTYCANYIKKRIKELKGEKDVED